MDAARAERDAHIVGREPELAALDDFLAGGGRGLVLTGEAGIGKTTLWEAGADAARRRGMRVLAARPGSAEARLAFIGLADLLDGVDLGSLDGVPAVQRRALELALLRSEPDGPPPEPRAVALGLLSALRALAAARPVLVAVDDTAWLDAPSASALAFAARRLDGAAAVFLLSRRRATAPPALERALGSARVVEVTPLGVEAVRRLLADRLGLRPSRRELRRLHRVSGGNPLFALELGRGLSERGGDEPGATPALPEGVEEALGVRVGRLPAPSRRALLAAALSPGLGIEPLEAVAGAEAIDEALATGLLVLERGRLRASHPVLGAAAIQRARPGERRRLHAELARAVPAGELRARHLALASERPDEDLAATVADAATSAASRAAVEEAVELAAHALRLTPPASPRRPERLLALAERLVVAGEPERATDLVEPELARLPSGGPRGRAQLLLADAATESAADYDQRLALALAESEQEPLLRAEVLARKAEHTAVVRVERIAEAEAWAREALALSAADAAIEVLALHALAWTRILRGRGVEQPAGRFRACSGATAHLYRSPERAAAVRLAWRGDVAAARERLTRLLSLAEERGEEWSHAVLRLHLCELELRAGGWAAAAALLDDWDEASDGALVVVPIHDRCRALLAAGRGRAEEAERWAGRALARSDLVGGAWDRLEALRARGMAALLAHDPERAATSLRAVWAHVLAAGVEDPGAFPVAGDLVEALVELGEQAEARTVAARLAQLARRQGHPWGLATAARCDALLRLATGTDDTTPALEVAAGYERLGLGFDRARTLLALGRAQRRRRRWRAARSALEEAAAAFERLGSAGWAQAARAEVGRVGARRPRADGELTPSERRAAELAATGLANKEIAAALHIRVHTVEVHLSHAYAKLGVSSRGQLASRLRAANP